jgi:hypothetical protein
MGVRSILSLYRQGIAGWLETIKIGLGSRSSFLLLNNNIK